MNSRSFHITSKFLLFLSINLGNSLYAQSKQELCYPVQQAHLYAVDKNENNGEGSTGSTYKWNVLEHDFNGTISEITLSGNQIKINWGTTPLGKFTLIVEEDNGDCLSEQQLTIEIKKNCELPIYNDLVIPNFISPNGDGLNDKWIIQGLEGYPQAEFSIYNRYGKLLIQKTCSNICEWDGKINGNPLPSTDYWYQLKLDNETIKQGHISLKTH